MTIREIVERAWQRDHTRQQVEAKRIEQNLSKGKIA